MKVVILCGGKGTRLREETEIKPKPMVKIGGKPILWHIMKIYSHYGFREFILCLGYKGEIIKEYFYNYNILNNDFTIDLGSGGIELHNGEDVGRWKITMVDTGIDAMTGARVKRIEKYIDSDTFLLTYGDGVTDLNIRETVAFHRRHGKIGTVTGVFPPSRYGELAIQEDEVISFSEKPKEYKTSINGGFFVFNKRIFEYLGEEESCILERGPLEKLAKDRELKVFHHRGFWQCMDTYRDYKYLNELWRKKNPPWKVWDRKGKEAS
ncbi:MAG: glucose-1-phosphate cytidylyltransferase [Candidatus Hydrogenedentota bacterium]|nr:MAG: glucose-1-phosphate cytidylyltransferase [Candidatus Hydrogenedentota bacterium]